MPAFNGNLSNPYTDVRVGESFYLFNNESLTAGENSVVMCRGMVPGASTGQTTFQWQTAVAPTCSVILYGGNFPPTAGGPQNGFVITTFTAQSTTVDDTFGYAFYWAYVTSYAAGGNATLLAQR